MIRELLQSAPLLILPLVAFVLFVTVFVVVVFRAMTKDKGEVRALARLPLEETRHE